MLGEDQIDEHWRVRLLIKNGVCQEIDDDTNIPAPTPIRLHPVHIKALVRNNDCPVIRSLRKWFHPFNLQMIYQETLPIGRFLQAAYN